jgi:CheY-like chemotaxis protein
MAKIHLVHWNIEEAEKRAEILRQEGHIVDASPPNGPPFLRKLSDDPPDAVVIDLSRLPSHGREVATSIRMRKSTRSIPLVFVGGETDKVEIVRSLFPDAIYTDWEGLLQTLQAKSSLYSMEEGDLVVPQSIFDVYLGRPLVKKLGIKAGAKIGLVGEPTGFVETLGELPEGVSFLHDQWQDCELIIWFVRSLGEYEAGLPGMAERLTRGSLWIAWPKKTSAQAADLTQQVVRDLGLAQNLVDYKICSIDDTWSALLFTRRK